MPADSPPSPSPSLASQRRPRQTIGLDDLGRWSASANRLHGQGYLDETTLGRRFQKNMSIATTLGLAARAAPPAVKRTILNRDDFVAACERERARSERSGLAFSLLLFQLAPASDSEKCARLETFLDGRLRLIDEIGRLDSGVVAALLPYTAASGAAKVAADGLTCLEDAETPPEVRLFVYPWNEDPQTPEPIDAPSSPGAELTAEDMGALFCRSLPPWKRVVDLVGATTAAVLAAPVLLAAAAAVRLSSPGPAFFAQWRAGAGGRPFRMYKLRTMYVGAEASRDELAERNEQDGPAFKIVDDPRVTPIGRLLRKSSIDELPQIWNVLRGEMSLVGPRPLPCEESDAAEPWQRRRLDVTPGLTCIWQTRRERFVPFDHWMRMDLAYVRRRGLWRDAWLLWKTIPTVLLGRTAS